MINYSIFALIFWYALCVYGIILLFLLFSSALSGSHSLFSSVLFFVSFYFDSLIQQTKPHLCRQYCLNVPFFVNSVNGISSFSLSQWKALHKNHVLLFATHEKRIAQNNGNHSLWRVNMWKRLLHTNITIVSQTYTQTHASFENVLSYKKSSVKIKPSCK